MSARIELRSLSKSYGDVEAAKDIDLVVEPGEFLTLLGPSGSGKTTTMMCIAGFTQPTSGDILIDDRSVVDLSPHKRSLGIVFQNYALFPHLSVYDNVAFALRERKVPRRETKERVDRVLEVVDLVGHNERRITQLSGGQQQRVALARAMVFDPPLLLMDEPLSALDKKLRDAMQIELKRIQRRIGVTVIYVTHDQSEALALSDRIAIMDKGRIEQIGTPLEVYNEPGTPFVGDFLGESNLFVAKLNTVQDGVVGGVTSNGLPFRGLSRAGLSAGSTVTMMVRPERILIWKDVEGGAPGHLLSQPDRGANEEGVVSETVYLGDSSRVVVEVSGEELIVRVTNRPGEKSWQIGDVVRVGWSIESTQVMFGDAVK